ncbi:STAS domain-containing protein [Streptosporangium saharense]|uniref:STAS domain-containing protein n=1 Tax=Streptosporangium saharense TaxID=1706840 RepID=UPI00342B6068
MNAIIGPHTYRDPLFEPFTFAYRRVRIMQTLDPAGLRIEGDLDATTLSALTAALAAVTGPGEDVCLDLAAVTFIDIGALRAVITATGRLTDGHLLTLRSAPSQMRRLMEITGWGDTPGLLLQGATVPSPDCGK